MRVLGSIGAAFLIAFAIPAASRADGPAPAASAATSAAATAPDCKCPTVQKRSAVRPRRHARHHRRWHPPPIAVAPAPALPSVYYNPGIPSPYNTAYDRAMVLHFRSPIVSGLYDPEPGYPQTPPVAGVQPYRVPTGATMTQYDGLIGEYVQLAADDPSHEFNVAAAPPPTGAPSAPPPAQAR